MKGEQFDETCRILCEKFGPQSLAFYDNMRKEIRSEFESNGDIDINHLLLEITLNLSCLEICKTLCIIEAAHREGLLNSCMIAIRDGVSKYEIKQDREAVEDNN